MKVVYSLPHPSDRLDDERAGHIVRANALLAALERQGHTVVRVQASDAVQGSEAAVSTYRQVIKKLIPRPIALRLRDAGRMAYARRYADRLTQVVEGEAPDFILETQIGFSNAGATAAERTGVPLVMDDVAPALEEEGDVGYGVGLKGAAVEVLHEVTEKATVVVAVSEVLKEKLIAEGVAAEKVVRVPNGIDAAAFHPDVDGSARREALNIPEDTLVIVFVGSFQPFHRVDLLLDAAASLAELPLHLLLVGDGPTAEDARAQAESLGITERATFTGRIPYAEVATYAAAGEIAVMPGVLHHGNSMKLHEYMALGLPVVAPDLASIREVVTHTEDAMLFTDGDLPALRETLATLLSDGDLRARLASAAVERSGNHTWDARAATIVEAVAARRA